MLISILAPGSRGDTQPFVALGVELVKSGFRVRLVGFSIFADLVENNGLEFFPLKGDLSRVMMGNEAEAARKADNPLKVLLSFRQLRNMAIDVHDDLYQACSGADAIVYHPGASIGYFFAQSMGIPGILASPFPMTPTREYPSLIFYNSIRLGKTWNYASHKIFEQIMWMVANTGIKHFWKRKFGQLPDGYACPFGQQITKKYPTIISCSQHVFATPQDWPDHVHACGYWFLDENWSPPTDLVEFIEAGPAPVYIGFGSIGSPRQAEETTSLVIKALEESGDRGILATGWNGIKKLKTLPKNIFMLESASHAWLFPRMSAVVHHGGAGTTAAGLRAGIPAIIIPHSNDQFAWGKRLHELGVSPKPIPRKSLTVKKLTAALMDVKMETMIHAAKQLGDKIRSEDGQYAAAKIISDCIKP